MCCTIILFFFEQEREKRSISPEKADTCSKQNGEYMSKAYRRLESWTRSFELSKDFGFVNYPMHQTAVTMLRRRTKVTRTTSIMELLLIERMLTPINEINESRPIHQPGIIDEKDRSTSPKGKGERTESEQEKVTVAVVNIANHCLMYKLLHFETSMNSHLKAERNIEQTTRSRTPT